jgi:DNA-binding Xre family transcriptional regulator
VKRVGYGLKLTSTQVIHIKKRLQDPKRKTRIKMLAKQFGVSEMQINRIRTGENWGHIKV